MAKEHFPKGWVPSVSTARTTVSIDLGSKFAQEAVQNMYAAGMHAYQATIVTGRFVKPEQLGKVEALINKHVEATLDYLAKKKEASEGLMRDQKVDPNLEFTKPQEVTFPIFCGLARRMVEVLKLYDQTIFFIEQAHFVNILTAQERLSRIIELRKRLHKLRRSLTDIARQFREVGPAAKADGAGTKTAKEPAFEAPTAKTNDAAPIAPEVKDKEADDGKADGKQGHAEAA